MPDTPTDLTAGDTVSEAKLDNIDDWINFFAGLKSNGTAIGALAAASELEIATEGYDSDWFAVAANTLYTKAHNFASVPRFVRVYFNSSGTAPGTSVYEIDMQSWDTRFKIEFNTVNIRIDTDMWLILDSYWGTFNTGWARIRAWA